MGVHRIYNMEYWTPTHFRRPLDWELAFAKGRRYNQSRTPQKNHELWDVAMLAICFALKRLA